MKHASAAVRIRTSILLALALLMSYVPLPKAYSAGEKSSQAGQAKSPTAPGAKVGAATLEAARRKARVAYGKLPIYFEANRGQFDPEVRFVSRGSGPKTFLTPTEAVFVLSKPQTKSGPRPEAGSRNASEPPAVADGLQLQPHSRSTAQGVAQNKLRKEERVQQRAASKAVVRMSLAGASAATQVTGLEQLPGNLNYFRGNNPNNWVTDVPIFNRVRYTQVYPGIDLIYYGNGRQLEYDFVVAPGADPRRIGFDFEGAERVEVDESTGELVVHAAGGAQLRQGKPVIYQEVEGSKRAIAGGFAVSGSRVGFALGEYDAARPLIIDPVVFSYSTYLAGENNDRAHDITVDADGNAYIAGWTESDSFPTKNAYQPGNNGFQQAFITKLDPSGSALVWSTYLGGGERLFSEGAYGITIDADRNVYVTGFTDSADFPTRNPLQPHLSNNDGGYDSFITKLNAAGNQLVFSTYFGGPANDDSGNGDDIGRGIALDSNNNVYVVGYTDSPAFPTTNAIQEEIDGRTTQLVGESNNFDAYLAKIDASGQFRIYSTYIGGAFDDLGLGVAVDADGNAYVTGWTQSTEEDPTLTPDPPEPNHIEEFDLPTANSGPHSIAVGPDGHIYFTELVANQIGRLNIPADPTPTPTFTEFPLPDQSTIRGLFCITANPSASLSPDPNVYFGEADLSQIGQLDPTALPTPAITESAATDACNVSDVTSGPDGRIYYTQSGGCSQLGRFDPAGPSVTNFTTTCSLSYGITDAPDGLLYYLDGCSNVVQFDPATELETVSLVSAMPFCDQSRITPGPGGDLFYTGGCGDSRIGRLNPTSAPVVETLYNIPNGAAASGITAGPDGNIYFTQRDVNRIGRLNPATGQIHLFPIPTAGSQPRDITAGPDGNLYFTEFDGNKIGRFKLNPATPDPAPLPPNRELFPTTEGAFQEGPSGTGFTIDAFVTKVNSAGSAYVYSTFLGGAGEDVSWGIALGSDGSAYVTGYTDSENPTPDPSATPTPTPSPAPQTGYPTTANAYQQENNGGYDAFLTRLSPDGSNLIYSTYIGGDDDEGEGDGECPDCGDPYDGAAIAVDFAGNAYITGWTESTFVAPTPEGTPVVDAVCGNETLESPPEQCDDGNTTSGDGCSSTCQTEFVNFPTKDAAQPQPGSAPGDDGYEDARDAYVAKFNTNAAGEDSLIYSTFLGGSRRDEGQGIAVDLAANAYVVGWTETDGSDCCDMLMAGTEGSLVLEGPNDFPTTPGAFQEQPVEEDDGFITKVGGGGSSTGDGEDNFSIVGRVTRPDGVSGVSGVTITLTRPDNTTATDTTDANGYYAFDDLAPGTYTVTPSGGSSTDIYSPPSQEVTITNENERADFTATQTFSISGRVTTDGTTGLGGVTITVTRATDNEIVGTATTAADGTYTVAGLLSDEYIVTPSQAFYTFAPPSQAVTVDSNETGVDFIATSAPGTVGFTAAASPGGSESSRDEDDKSFQITVTRIGDTSGTTDVDYATFDGPAPGPSAQPSPGPPPASERSDYITALGRLHFAPNETTKTITIFIVDDAFVEGNEVLTLVLSSPTNNVALGPPNAVTLTIVDNDSNPSAPNPIDNTGFFVRQHYLDFLNREPDAGGLAFWSNEINKCSNPANRGPGETEAQCIDRMRVQVSKAFFLSIEFQETGFFVIRTYRAALDRHPEFREFLKDTQEIQRGVVVGQSGWEAQLEAKKQAYLRDFVRRPEFLTRYPESQTRDQYIDALFASAAFTPTTAERQQVSNAYDSGAPDQTESRALALGALADLTRFRQREFNPAFVKMQYIGYLRRNPDEPGFNFWLGVLNANNDQNQMVKAFIVSGEYRQRFGL